MKKNIGKPKPYPHVGHFLKRKRIAAGLSQRQVCEALGYSSTQFISNWERGLASPPMGALARLVQIYKIGKNDFMEEMMRDKKLAIEGELGLAFRRRLKA